jgi:ISXO2-like transposase domain
MRNKSQRPGVYQCKGCDEQFTVTVGTVFERSHVPLNKWVLALQLMAASKKGMSAHQIHRMLSVIYKTAWFMAMRIREALADSPFADKLGGFNKVVEVDETYIGGKEANKHKSRRRTDGARGPVGKAPVLSLVERDGAVRSQHVANVSAATLRPILRKHIDGASYVMTDESPVYPPITGEFAGHGRVNHSAEEYVRAYFWHTNTAENYFSILKRGIVGVYHHVSEAHLHRGGVVEPGDRARSALRLGVGSGGVVSYPAGDAGCRVGPGGESAPRSRIGATGHYGCSRRPDSPRDSRDDACQICQ